MRIIVNNVVKKKVMTKLQINFGHKNSSGNADEAKP